MSWIKNLWDRLFFQDTDEEIIEVAPEQETEPDVRPKKSPFRFPVITDTEKEAFLKQNPRGRLAETVKREKPKAETLHTAPKRRPHSPALNQNRRHDPGQPYLPDYDAPKQTTPMAEAYMVSKPAKKPIPRTTAPRAPREVQQPVARPVSPKPSRPATQPYEAPKFTKTRHVDTQPIKKTRSFQPTRVPSPVYGYGDANSVPALGTLEKKGLQIEEKKIQPEQSPQDIRINETDMSRNMEKEAAVHANETAALPAAEHVPELMIVEEQPLFEDNQPETEEVQLNEITPDPQQQTNFENRETADLIAQPDVEAEKAAELPSVEQSLPITPDSVEPKAIKEAAKPETKREKTVPFNVLMLKSDKERQKKNSQARPAVLDRKPATENAEPLPAKKRDVKTQLMSEVIASSQPAEPVQEPVQVSVQETAAPYEYPKLDFLRPPENDLIDETWMEEQGERLIEALSYFQIQASILSIVQGPAVTQFELTVAQGVKVSKIRNLADDLKLALAARDIRIQAPIPGKSSIGIEIPNRKSRPVRISEVIGSPVFKDSESPLEAAMGLDLTGKPVTLDLRKMPHGLIAGATGSGKSVCINSLLVSLLYKSSPRDLKLLLIDPKMVELAPYNHIPHLISPVITDVKAATASLKWAVEEMERRYQLFAHVGVRDLNRYNKLVKEKGDHAQHLPYILIVIDELADLMMMSPSDVEDAICRIAQKARACGIHLVIATQRPSVDVITGLIKSNIPTRIAFSVSSQVDSRTILDSQGAERLLGRGDMLYLGNGMSAPVRLQGTFVTDDEIEEVIAHVRKQGEPEYFFKEEELIKRSESPDVQDDLFEEACRFIISQGSASTSLLQRKFHIGYNRAARLMDMIEQHGFISEQNGSKARAVLITEDDMADVFQ
ncbi:DNA translocase FtsK [Planococcus liqunii]|uniref:DNA translocase FtsK n=1 Tax=Planococcus liqunii TaxID=3058394 RepID=UPI00261545D1|nr:DNA translocase FtsK [Planococcus sp. N056]WKA52290.1 DNA translocase FtsK [Planococcus sp. N056]